jgi:hypothetical protein
MEGSNPRSGGPKSDLQRFHSASLEVSLGISRDHFLTSRGFAPRLWRFHLASPEIGFRPPEVSLRVSRDRLLTSRDQLQTFKVQIQTIEV